MAMKLFSGRANPKLAIEIAEFLGKPLAPVEIKDFKDREIYVRIGESIRGDDCFVIQPTCCDVNKNLMELLIMIDALKRASAKRITAVVPYYGYSRQDRKALPREPITAKLVADLIYKAGAHRVVTVDLHSEQIQGFFDIPFDSVHALPVKAEYLKYKSIHNLVFVSPDVGAVRRTRRMAKIFSVPIAIIDKRRPRHNTNEVMNIIGDIKNKTCVLIDDIIDTGGTICEAAGTLKQAGAKEVYVCVTHPILSGEATKKLNEAPIEEVIVTNTIPIPEEKLIGKIRVVSMAPMLGEVIRRINSNESLDMLYERSLKSVNL